MLLCDCKYKNILSYKKILLLETQKDVLYFFKIFTYPYYKKILDNILSHLPNTVFSDEWYKKILTLPAKVNLINVVCYDAERHSKNSGNEFISAYEKLLFRLDTLLTFLKKTFLLEIARGQVILLTHSHDIFLHKKETLTAFDIHKNSLCENDLHAHFNVTLQPEYILRKELLNITDVNWISFCQDHYGKIYFNIENGFSKLHSKIIYAHGLDEDKVNKYYYVTPNNKNHYIWSADGIQGLQLSDVYTHTTRPFIPKYTHLKRIEEFIDKFNRSFHAETSSSILEGTKY